MTPHPPCGSQKILGIQLLYTELNRRSQMLIISITFIIKIIYWLFKGETKPLPPGRIPSPSMLSEPGICSNTDHTTLWYSLDPLMLPDSIEGSGWTNSPRWMSYPVCNYSPFLEKYHHRYQPTQFLQSQSANSWAPLLCPLSNPGLQIGERFKSLSLKLILRAKNGSREAFYGPWKPHPTRSQP